VAEFILYKSIVCVIVFAVSLGIAAYSTWWERKFAALLQDRWGPSRAGKWGLLQPLADGGKMLFKEEIVPEVSNKFLFILAPGLFIVTAIMAGVLIPWAPDLKIGATNYAMQIADVNVGIIYLLSVTSVGVYGIMIGGWSSNNKYSLFGSIRASAQMISYELAMGISLIALIIVAGGTLSFREIVAQQDAGVAFVLWQPLGFFIFFVCALAECNRAPFDLAECETELIGGYHTEYSAFKLGLFLFAEYIAMFVSSAVIAGFYFGGYNFPFAAEIYSAMGLEQGSWLITLIGFLVYFVKTLLFISLFMWIRWTIPRFRYDQLMNLGWRTLLPLSLLNLLITVVIEYFRGNIRFD
jgi:NADH-quinone oxidoreductase subunit H